ncbi:MAG: MauE/DoxX family redox-associated membrane protein [Phycisphaerales bacterium JB059]
MARSELEIRVSFLCRMALALCFMWFLVAKLDAVNISAHGVVRGPMAFADAIARQDLIGPPWNSIVAGVVLGVETGMILWLVSALAPRGALLIALAFLIGVSAYLGAVAGLTGSDAPCGCTGSPTDTVSGALIRNGVLASIAGVGCLVGPRASERLRLDGRATGTPPPRRCGPVR